MSAAERAKSWCQMLRAVAEPVIAAIDLSANFADDFGHRREVDAPFIQWCRAWRESESNAKNPLRFQPFQKSPAFHVEPAAAPTSARPNTVDASLWHALASQQSPEAISAILEAARDLDRTTWDAGSLIPQSGMALEVWTETDLSAMHALWWLALRHARPDWRTLIEHAAAWHLDHIQPDNATAHPWSLHLFALRDITAPSGDGAARLHAEMMLHNCQVSLGRADRLSALILVDAARAIEVAYGV